MLIFTNLRGEFPHGSMDSILGHRINIDFFVYCFASYFCPLHHHFFSFQDDPHQRIQELEILNILQGVLG